VKAVIFGATGMIGKGVLLKCLDDPRVDQILLVSRNPIDISHPKIRELLHQHFFNFASIQSQFADRDACFGVMGPLYPMLRRLFPRYATTTVNIGRAMIEVAVAGFSKEILTSDDINRLAELARRREGGRVGSTS
jgi:hypothetical protein